MNVIEINNIYKLLLGARYIGHGATSICFLLMDGSVLKIYYNSFEKQELFESFDMLEQLTRISKIGNTSYIVPEKIYTHKNQVIAYAYSFVKAKTLKRLNPQIHLDDLIRTLDPLYEDTKLMSSFGFKNYDMHNKNILFNGNYRIIDLDKGSFEDNPNTQFLIDYNQRLLLQTITKYIFNDDELYFLDPRLHSLYRAMLYTDYKAYEEFFRLLKEEINMSNPKIKDIRYLKMKNKLTTY